MSVFKHDKINIEQINFSKIKKSQRGTQSVFMSFDDQRINLQTPRMKIPFGLNDNSKYANPGDQLKYHLNLSF